MLDILLSWPLTCEFSPTAKAMDISVRRVVLALCSISRWLLEKCNSFQVVELDATLNSTRLLTTANIVLE